MSSSRPVASLVAIALAATLSLSVPNAAAAKSPALAASSKKLSVGGARRNDRVVIRGPGGNRIVIVKRPNVTIIRWKTPRGRVIVIRVPTRPRPPISK